MMSCDDSVQRSVVCAIAALDAAIFPCHFRVIAAVACCHALCTFRRVNMLQRGLRALGIRVDARPISAAQTAMTWRDFRYVLGRDRAVIPIARPSLHPSL